LLSILKRCQVKNFLLIYLFMILRISSPYFSHLTDPNPLTVNNSCLFLGQVFTKASSCELLNREFGFLFS